MKLRYLLYSLTSLPLLLDGCQNPLEGIQIRVKDPIQQGVVECRLYDPAGNPLPQNSRISIAGPDADKVVTTLNTKKYKINADGSLLVAASPMVTLSSQQPMRFSTVVEAEGYLTIVQPFVLTNGGRQTRYVRQISMTKPPRTLSVARLAGRANADGTLPTTLSLTTAEQNTEADHATVTIGAGTKLTDREGQPVGGDLTMAVLHTNARTGDATSQVPGGGILSYVNGRNGGPSLGTLRVTSIAGSVSFEIFNGAYQLLTGLSQPARWTMELNPATINGQTGRAVQPGDSIPLYSYDAFSNRWQQEKPGVVVRNSQTGRLTYQAEASRAAAYVATWTEFLCDVGPVFKVSSKLTNVDVNYLCRLIDARTGAQVSAFHANVNNGALIRIYNQLPGRQLKLQIYDETDAWGKGAKGGLIAESAVGTTCDQTPIAVDLRELPVPPVMKLEFYFSCPAGTKLDESALPAMIRTQYSEAGKESWRDLITATRTERKVASYKLQVGRKYDLRASTDGGATWPLRENDYLVDKPDWTLKIRASMYCK
ncbi:hypothetical protein HNV11_03530 [Spirosoma taeanense]|uniref:Uncharacterized protein n=1 Tax=Spirosoma taeanense TaxID=2735870 RepID=A0A6M5Y1A1_9BACT|nr:hypothetical protein [Spirosoma taeanense]QJW88507.1 hypothetical protein HNV11_03530 [Spirosoma taeanense]